MKKLWCFWSDVESMSDKRREALRVLKHFCGVPVELITKDNYRDYESKDFAIHEAYQYLSDTHKSDYIRFYLCHLYGGGYCDIKPFQNDWNPYFDMLTDDVDLIGTPEIHEDHVAYTPYKSFFTELVSVNNYIMKGNSIISNDLMKNLHKFLDSKLKQLEKNPGDYHPRAVSKACDPTGVFQPNDSKVYESDYPISWNEMNGNIFHKIQYENKSRILKAMNNFPLPAQVYR